VTDVKSYIGLVLKLLQNVEEAQRVRPARHPDNYSVTADEHVLVRNGLSYGGEDIHCQCTLCMILSQVVSK